MLQARKIADDVYFIDAGKVLQSGPAEDVFSRPAAHFVAEFTGTRNVLTGLLYPDAAFKTGGLVIQTVPDETLLEKAVQSGAPVPAVATLGPEEILVSTGTVASSARNCLKATVKEVRRAGRVDEIIAEAGGVIFMALVTRQSTEQMSIVPGKEIYLTFKATSVNVIPA
jgi:molybdopterin-binding protein